jgi:polyferredoxin
MKYRRQTMKRRRQTIKRHRSLYWPRLLVQVAFVGIAIWLGVRAASGVQSFDSACPYGGVVTLWGYLSSGAFLRETGPLNLILLALLLVAAIGTGRAFCGWACPLGTVQEWLASLIRRLTGGRTAWLPMRPSRKVNRALSWLKYGVLGWTVWASATAVVPPLIPFCPYRTLFTLNVGSLLGWSAIVGLITLSFAVERAWCRYLCPLGALLAVTNKISLWRIRKDEVRCASCGLCDRACPVDLDVLREVEEGAECIRCRSCVRACPREGALRG